MFKKLFCLFSICTLILSCSLVNAQVDSTNIKITFKSQEITDLKTLEDRMNKGITDDKDFKGKCLLSTQEIVEETTGKTYKLNVNSVKATSQKTQETVGSSGNISTEYSANILASVSMVSSGGGDETPWNYDDNIGCNAKIYVHVIYLTETVDGYTIYKITSLSGKLEKLDSQIVLTKIGIAERCLGAQYSSPSIYEGQGQYNMTASANSPSNNTYYYNNSLSPYYWNLGDSTVTYIQGVVTGYFSRGGTSWSANVMWER